MSDNVPSGDAAFGVFFENIVNYVNQKTSGTPPAWSHIPQAESDKLKDAKNAWIAAYEQTKVPHTPVQTAEKNRVRKSSETFLREFINRFLRYAPVSNEDRDNMGIHNKKDRRSSVTVPTTSPQLTVDTGTRCRLIIYYKDEKSTRRGKPAGVHGIEVRWAILDHLPESIKELTNSAFDTNPPLTLEFDEQDRGKRVYMSGCWEIEREGEKGPPGAIVEAVIP
ncbi:MAG: hypothetical protein LBD79_05110 [Treponema sp.]|jgi:hypothetical protein|nr:hypothetical protein [Treponema sp.]